MKIWPLKRGGFELKLTKSTQAVRFVWMRFLNLKMNYPSIGKVDMISYKVISEIG